MRFADFELDVLAGELRRHDKRVPLSEQPLRLLQILVEHPGHVVSRDQLRERLWAEDTFVDFEHGVNAAVKRLRDALGDAADQPRFIETLPKRGYRFIAPIEGPPPVAEPAAGLAAASAPVSAGDGVLPSPVATAGTRSRPHAAAPRERSRHRRWMASALIIATAASLVLWFAWLRARSGERAWSATTRHLTRLTFGSGIQTDPTFSPDGRFIAYASDLAGSLDIWVKPVAGGDAVQVTRSSAQDSQPSWSPDGGAIAFRSERAGGGIYLVPALGGTERRLSAFGAYPSWSGDGSTVRFMSGAMLDSGSVSGFHEVPLNGGPPREVLPGFTRAGSWTWVAGHPDGRTSFLGGHEKLGWGFFTVTQDGQITKSTQVAGGDLLPPSHNAVVDRQRFQWNSTGTALFVESIAGQVRNLWRVAVDPVTLSWTAAERLTTGAGADVAATVSRDGTKVAFSTLHESERLWVFPLDQVGRRVGEGHPVSEEGAFAGQSELAPDGETVAFNLRRFGASANTLWLARLDTGDSSLLASNAGTPSWSRDGRRLAYLRWQTETPDPQTGRFATALAVRTLAGPEQLISPWDLKTLMAPSDWAPDGRAILVCVMTAHGERLARWPIDGSRLEPQTVLASPKFTFWQARYSPNGRWLSFVAFGQRGRADQQAGDEGPLIAVARAEGAPEPEWVRIAATHLAPDKPRWAPNGKRLYFLSKQGSSFLNVWGVEFDPERGHTVGEPFKLTRFDAPGLIISPRMYFTEMGISEHRLVLTMRTVAGNIWMLDPAHP